MLYIVQYPIRWTAQRPGRPVHSGPNSTSLGSILAMQQLHVKTKSLIFPPLSTAKYLFIQLSGLRSHGENNIAQSSKRCKGRIRTRTLSIASPAFYH